MTASEERALDWIRHMYPDRKTFVATQVKGGHPDFISYGSDGVWLIESKFGADTARASQQAFVRSMPAGSCKIFVLYQPLPNAFQLHSWSSWCRPQIPLVFFNRKQAFLGEYELRPGTFLNEVRPAGGSSPKSQWHEGMRVARMHSKLDSLINNCAIAPAIGGGYNVLRAIHDIHVTPLHELRTGISSKVRAASIVEAYRAI